MSQVTINYCHAKDCVAWKFEEWNGKFQDKWFCDKHRDSQESKYKVTRYENEND